MANKAAQAFKSSPELDETSMNFLYKALDKVKQGKLSFIDLKLSVDKLQAQGLSSEQAIKSVLTTAETLGVSKEELLDEGRRQLEAIDTEKVKFEEAMRKRLSDGLEADRQKITAAEAKLAQLVQQKAQLEQNIQREQEGLQQLEEDLKQVKTRVQETADNFTKAHSYLKNLLTADLQEVKQAN